MFISMMFAGHHTSSGTSSWTLIELLRHPDVYADVRRRTRGALRRRPGGEFPCAAPDSEAGQRRQGDAAAASAADHPDAGGQGRVRGRGLPDPRGRLRRRVARDLQPDRRGLPGPRRVQPGPLQQARAGRHRSTGGRGFRSAPGGTAASAPRSPPCRSRRSSRFCCASTSSRWHSRPTATATTTRRWWCSWPGPPRCATAGADGAYGAS